MATASYLAEFWAFTEHPANFLSHAKGSLLLYGTFQLFLTPNLHYIRTNGTPCHSRPRRLTCEKSKLARAENEHTIQLGTRKRLEQMVWHSSLHLKPALDLKHMFCRAGLRIVTPTPWRHHLCLLRASS